MSIISVILLATAASGSAVDDSLLKSSRVVADTTDWQEAVATIAEYEWISRDELLFYRTSRSDSSFTNLFTYSQLTRRTNLLQGLTKTYNSMNSTRLEPSADGKLFAAGSYGEKQSFYVVDVDGNIKGTWPRRRIFTTRWDPTQYMTLHWTSDSKGTVDSMIEYSDHGKLEGLAISSQLRPVDQPDHSKQFRVESPEFTVDSMLPDAIGPNYRFMSVDLAEAKYPKVKKKAIVTFWKGGAKKRPAQSIIEFPEGFGISDWEFSPDGEYILWKTTNLTFDDGFWYFEGGKKPAPPEGPFYVHMWLTRWDGAHKRWLGSIRLSDDDTSWDWHKFGGMRFVPGGDQISFIYKHQLYVRRI